MKLKQAESHLRRYAEAASTYPDKAGVRLDYPKQTPLWQVHTLANVDRHRTLTGRV